MNLLLSPAYLFTSYAFMFILLRKAPKIIAKYIGIESPKSEHVFLLFLVSPLTLLFLIWTVCYDVILFGFSTISKRLFPIKQEIEDEPS